ncbi:MAG: dioxygenase [Anaerolineae bacterium]|nr:dioxygenase [Anaerolineae bacterium]
MPSPQPTEPPATPTQPPPTQAPPTQPPPTPTAEAQAVPQLPVCNGVLAATPAQTEGPYYKANTPERASLLEPGMAGTKLIVTGYVLTTDCKPVAGVWLDFWQTDDKGAYDNSGYRMRGHQFTDETGRYYLETVVPGGYPGRTPHIHVKVRAPNGPVLTTQIYLPGEPRNNTDSIFKPELVMSDVRDTADGKTATFNFVLMSRN